MGRSQILGLVQGLSLPCSAQQTSQCMWLMQALGFLLSALQVEEILKNLHSLITPYIQQLEKLAEEMVREACLLEAGQWETTESPGRGEGQETR